MSASISAEAMAASGRGAERLSMSLLTLQSKMKVDPEGYESELALIYGQFSSSVELFRQQAALNFSSVSGIGADPAVAKDLADRASFLAHMTPFYPERLSQFPAQLAELLLSSARSLPSGLRTHVTQSLVLLINRNIVKIEESLALFMELQTLGDRVLRKLAFSHVVHSIKRMNQKHKNGAKNRPLQNIIFSMLQNEDEAKAKRALVTLCELHRRKIWFDERTANAICTACFHSSSRIMIAALSFLLDYEKIENDDDSDDSSSDDETNPEAHAVLSRESIYKAHNKGTSSSKKKKKAKLQRAIRTMKKKQRLSNDNTTSSFYSPLNHLLDPQGFTEKLFSRLQTCNERFEVKMMVLKVIARTIGLHRLLLLNFYPYLQKYSQPHQRDITSILAAAVQACHDMVPPDAVEPLFRQIVNQFVHDKSRPEAIAVGLNVIREICLRMPLLMTEELLQDLALYKKSHEKAVSIASRSLISLFRQICPSLLIKKDRGRPVDPTAKPKAYGEVNIPNNVADVELLEEEDSDDVASGSDDDHDDEMVASDDDEANLDSDVDMASEGRDDTISVNESDGDVSIDSDESEDNEDESESDDEEGEEDNDDHVTVDGETGSKGSKDKKRKLSDMDETMDGESESKGSKEKKRKLSDFERQLVSADSSLRALKKLAVEQVETAPEMTEDGILTNEDFRRIKQLKAKKEAKLVLNQHGLLRKGADAKTITFNIPSSDQLSAKRVDPDKLEAHVRRKMSKEERLALVRAGREDRGKYQAKAAVKQKKTGGMSNRQKEHKKALPLAAKRAKISKSRIEKKRKQSIAGKQFRGRKAWK